MNERQVAVERLLGAVTLGNLLGAPKIGVSRCMDGSARCCRPTRFAGRLGLRAAAPRLPLFGGGAYFRNDFCEALIEARIVRIGHSMRNRDIEEVACHLAERNLGAEFTRQPHRQ